MPAVLALTDINTKEHIEGRKLINVDDKLCAHLGVTPDEKLFYRDWVDRIGLSAAVGLDYDALKKRFEKPEDRAIIDFLEANYLLSCYYER